MSSQNQAELGENREPFLFKGFNDIVQMLNFVVFHLFTVLNVPANDIQGISGEQGEILGLGAERAARIGLDAMNSDVR